MCNNEMVFQTNRCIMRQYTQNDLESLQAILGDEEVMRVCGGVAYSLQESKEWLGEQIEKYKNQNFGIWAIIDKESGKLIGDCGIDYVSIPNYNSMSSDNSEQKVLQISYLLHKEYWHKGYGFEAATACVEYAFRILKANAVYFFINEGNEASIHITQKLGAKFFGINPKITAFKELIWKLENSKALVHLESQDDKLSLEKKRLNYSIAVAEKKDLKEILTLQHRAFVDEAKRVGKMDIEPLTQDLQSIKQEFQTQMILKYTLENGEIVGSVRGITKDGTTHIAKLFVDSQYRKKGIASALIQALCVKLPAKRYEIFTSERSLENIALYEKLGFVRFKIGRMKDLPIKAVFLEKFAANIEKTILKSERTILRELQQDDYKELHTLLEDLQTNKAYGWIKNINKLQEWLDEQLNAYAKYGFGLWAIIDRQSSKFIGIAGFKNEGYKEIVGFEKPLELQYFIKPKQWNQGYGKEVVQACMHYAFSFLQSQCVYSIIAYDNKASKALAVSLGMQEVSCDSKQGIKDFAKSLEIEIIDKPKKDFPILYLKQQHLAQANKIQTNRCALRPYTQEDFDTLHVILSDAKTMYAWGHGFEIQESKEWLNKQMSNYQKYGFGIWAVVEKQSGKIIGNVGLDWTEIDLDENKKKVVEIGYIVKRNFWNKGLATECALACLEYAFKNLGLEEVYCLVKEDNVASQKVAQKLGMRKIGEQVKQYRGKELPHFVFKIEKQLWQQQNR